MANQAFALSPISARASLPSEEDYEAIREAFVETARGRWFLDEYAKRNRNTDTRMVLDAVARIEESLAAQRQPPPPIVVDRLPAALTSIRSAVEKAEGAASSAFDGLRLEENLAPIRKGARIIKEISWRWREIGADGRICDLLDSQVTAIDTACSHLAETDPRVALRAAFEIIRTEIEAFRGNAAAEMPPVAEAAVQAAAKAAAPIMLRPEVAIRPAAEAAPAKAAAAAPAPTMAEVAVAHAARDEATAPLDVETAFSEPEQPVETTVGERAPAELSQEEADAEDEAVLSLVALEMAAPDADDVPDMPAASETEPVSSTTPLRAESEPAHATTFTEIRRVPVTTPPMVEPIHSFVRADEPELPEVEPAAPALQPSLRVVPSVAPEPVDEASLGSTLIARGILRKPSASANDPLAAIRRMTQAEKIAFFS